MSIQGSGKIWADFESTTDEISYLKVKISYPSDQATFSGKTVNISSIASSDIVGVQFKLNGNNLGIEDTVNPYTIVWDTTTISNGTYTLTPLDISAPNLEESMLMHHPKMAKNIKKISKHLIISISKPTRQVRVQMEEMCNEN